MIQQFLAVLMIAGFASAIPLANEDPTQVRLAFAGAGGMTVSWYTSAKPSSTPTVAYGLSSAQLSFTGTGSYTTYGTGFFSNVVLTGLTPFTFYYYAIQGDSTLRNFTTAMASGDDRPFSVGVVGDIGLVNSKNTIANMIGARDVLDFYYLIGDMSYADDWYLRIGDTYEGSWNKWQLEVEPITSVKPVMTLPGNHEVTCSEATPFACAQNTRNFTAYRHRFRMPFMESGAVNNLWFSYDYGSVHFVSISTETDFPGSPEGPGTYLGGGPFGDQLGWLEKDLAAANANRAKVPWIVVGGHRPFYSAAGGCETCRTAFEPLFLKHNVDIYFAGHVHWYERLYPIANGKVTQKNYIQPTAPVHLIIGCGGNVEGHEKGGALQDYDAVLDKSDFGYARFEVLNTTAIHWRFFRATDNVQADEIIISKQH